MTDEHEERDEHENPRPTVDLDALRAQAQGWTQLEIWTYLLRSYVDPREAAEIARGWIKNA